MSPNAAEPATFSPKVVLGLVMAAVLAAAAYALLSAYAPDLRSGEGGDNALSSSATGYGGIVRLMRLVGHPVLINRTGGRRTTYPGLMVLTPQPPLAPADLRPDHPRLVVLPKWRTVPDPIHQGWVRSDGLVDPLQAARIIPPVTGSFKVVRDRARARAVTLRSSGPAWPREGVRSGPIDRMQTAAGANLWPVLTDDAGRIVVGVMPDGHTYVLTEPDLLNTQGLRDPNTAKAAVALLSALGGPGMVAFDVTLNGFESRHSLLRLALEPPFLGATLCLLAAAGLVGLQGWNRFGPALRPGRAVALGKTALAENGAGMVRLAGREPRMALRYARLCRQRAAVALGADHLEPVALDEFLDRWADRVGAQERITTLIGEAAQVTKIADLAPLAQRTRRWRLEMTREPG
jgi:hypothetical protein